MLVYPISNNSTLAKIQPEIRYQVEATILEKVKDKENKEEFMLQLDMYISELQCKAKELFREAYTATEHEKLLIEKMQKELAVKSIIAIEFYAEFN